MSKRSKKNKQGKQEDVNVKEETTTNQVDEQSKQEEVVTTTTTSETVKEEQKTEEASTLDKSQGLSDSVVLVNSSLNEKTSESPKKQNETATANTEVKTEKPEPVVEQPAQPQTSPQKTETKPVQEEHKSEPVVESPKKEEPKKEEPKKEEPKVETPKKEEPKVEHPVVEQPKKEEPKKEEPKKEEPKKEEPKVEAPKHEEPKVEHPVVEQPKKEEPKKEEPKKEEPKKEVVVEQPKVEAQDTPKKTAPVQQQASEKKVEPVVSPTKDHNEPLVLDSSISKNFEVVRAQTEESDAASDRAQAPSESRNLDDLSVPSISQRSSIDVQQFTVSKENSVAPTFSDKLNDAKTLANEATVLRVAKDFKGANAKLTSAVELIKPVGLSKEDSVEAAKYAYAYTLEIADNYLSLSEPQQAITYANVVLDSEPGNLRGSYIVSQAFLQQNKKDDAIAALRNGLEKSSKKAREEQKALVEKIEAELKKHEPVVPEKPVVQTTEEKTPSFEKKAGNEENKSESQEGTDSRIAFAVGTTIAGAGIGLLASKYLLKINNGGTALVTAGLAVVTGLIGYFGSSEEKKK